MDEDYHFNGKVSIIAMTEAGLANYDIKDRLVLLGNDKTAQEEAYQKRCRRIGRCLGGRRSSDEVLTLAKQHHCPIILFRTWNNEYIPLFIFCTAGQIDHGPFFDQL